jgi:hypothetical protein
MVAVMRKTGAKPRPHSGPLDPRAAAAWVAVSWVDEEGMKASSSQRGALAVVAVCVNSGYPAAILSRIRLVESIARSLKSQLLNHASLWVFPGGYFGYERDGLRADALQQIDEQMRSIIRRHFPQNTTTVAAGIDPNDRVEEEEVWVWSSKGGPCLRVQRGSTPADGRQLQLAGTQILAAFFTCGEFTGSRTRNNRPFYRNEFLLNFGQQFPGCRVAVDLAHERIRGTVNNIPPPRRNVHEGQMLSVSAHAAAVLTHHHEGALTKGRARTDSQSNWIVYRGGVWFDGHVTELASVAPAVSQT